MYWKTLPNACLSLDIWVDSTWGIVSVDHMWYCRVILSKAVVGCIQEWGSMLCDEVGRSTWYCHTFYCTHFPFTACCAAMNKRAFPSLLSFIAFLELCLRPWKTDDIKLLENARKGENSIKQRESSLMKNSLDHFTGFQMGFGIL